MDEGWTGFFVVLLVFILGIGLVLAVTTPEEEMQNPEIRVERSESGGIAIGAFPAIGIVFLIIFGMWCVLNSG